MGRVILYGLVAFGVWSGGRLSYLHFLSGEACPILKVVPACYIAFAGYVAMAVALVIPMVSGGQAPTWLSGLFWLGLGIAGGLALMGSAFELIQGDVCPKGFGWLPMCYVSLAFSVIIGILYAKADSRLVVRPVCSTALFVVPPCL